MVCYVMSLCVVCDVTLCCARYGILCCVVCGDTECTYARTYMFIFTDAHVKMKAKNVNSVLDE